MHTKEIYAQWAVETMFLISLTLKFETKILDIAYLLLLKLMKEPSFEIDFKYIQLYIKVLMQQGKNKEALEFIEKQADHFEGDKTDRQLLEADLHFKQSNTNLCINTYFQILKSNSRVENYKDMQAVYTKLIRIIVNDFVIKGGYKFVATPEFLAVEGSSLH